MTNRQLFIISPEVYKATSEEEVLATAKGLEEFGIYRLPYDRVTVRLPLDVAGVMSKKPTSEMLGHRAMGTQTLVPISGDPEGRYSPNFGPHHHIEIRNVNLVGEPVEVWFIHEGADKKFKPYALDETERYAGERGEFIRESVARFLIVLLSTRNIIKTVKENRLARLGIGKRNKGFDYITTISLPQPETLEPDVDHPPTGRTVIPHLRRGHGKMVPYGPGRTLRRPRWIAATFVNADKDWVATRTAYHIGGAS